MKIKKVILIFASGDNIPIDSKYIKDMKINDVYNDFEFHDGKLDIGQVYSANYVKITIDRKVNNIFNRIINSPDIQCIRFIKKNNKYIEVYPIYDSKSYYASATNRFQSAKINKDKNLIIIIKE